MYRPHAILSFCLCALLLVSCGAEKAMKKGDKAFATGDYYDAATQYRKAYAQVGGRRKEEGEKRKAKGRIAAKMATCYRRIGQTSKAISAYKNVVRYKQTDSLTHLYLGQLYLKNGNYKEAGKTFQTLLDSIQQRSDYADAAVLTLARNGLLSAQQAPVWKKEGSAYTVKRMDIFNSKRADFSPVLGGEEDNQLYFTSTRPQAQGEGVSGITGTKNGDIFMAQKDEQGRWQKPLPIDSELNSEHDEGACCFSPDGKTMYLTLCKTDPNYPRYATIVSSKRQDASWSKPTEVVIARDTLTSFAHPAVSPDGHYLYFTSDMPGGIGGLDIWRCAILPNGEMGAMENLGPEINTPGNEAFPTFRPNGDFYFSSDGHPGMGGMDIFCLISNEELVHPGSPLNSQGDDFGMTFEGRYNRGYFCSNRGDGRGFDHIYSFYNQEIVQTVKGWVYEQDGYELQQAQVYMVGNDGTNLKLSVRGDGSFTQEVKAGTDYVLMAVCKGFLNHQEELHVEPVTESKEHILQFPLANISAPVLIENIFYDFDKATLRPESQTALDQLVKLLEENPNVTIELSAHTDYKGSDEYNERLSQRRAESVVNYLIAHGIASDRLTPKGYGEQKPKRIKRKVAEKYPFLKEGDTLTEAYVTQLPEEQQEVCNQMNRRTEFIVLRTTYGLFDKEGKILRKPTPATSSQE